MDGKKLKSEKVIINNNLRFIIVDSETGEVLDDAQGYGYKTIKGAIKAYKFKRLTKDERKERENKIALVKKWVKHNKKIMNFFEEISLEIWKGSWGPDDRFDEKLVKKILIENGYDIDELGFTMKDLLKYGFN
jgi:transcription initiation factor TFIID subunit TAF12